MIYSYITVSTGLIGAIVDYVAETAEDRRSVIEALSLKEESLRDPKSRTSINVLRKLWAAVLKKTDDPLLGLHIGEASDIGSFGLIDYVAVNSADFRQGLERVARYLQLVNSIITAETTESDSEGRLVQSFRWDVFGLERHAVDMTFAAVVAGSRKLFGAELKPKSVRFKHPDAGLGEEYSRVFGAPIIFGAEENALVFDKFTLDRKIANADLRLGTILEQQARANVDELPDPAHLPTRVSQILAKEIPNSGGVSLPDVARLLKLPPRQLQRALSDSGTTFSELQDDVRKSLAIQYLKEPSTNVEQVGYRLGFSDSASFVRAFKKWFEMTPGEYRKRNLGRDD